MKKDKELSLEELENVNGGVKYKDSETVCLKCKKTFDGTVYYVTHGSGCDEKNTKNVLIVATSLNNYI